MSAVAATRLGAAELERKAQEHLWLHFTRMGGLSPDDVPITVSPAPSGGDSWIAGSARSSELEQIAGVLGDALTEAEAELRRRAGRSR